MSIVVEDYHKTYGDTVAVAGITFTVAPGEILGLVGPNGAGKTTLFSVCSGLIRPDEGTVTYRGRRIDGLPPHRIAFQNPPRSLRGGLRPRL